MTALSPAPANRTTVGFLSQFLRIRQLSSPPKDQPLYTYKISDQEFVLLNAVLRTCREWNRYTSACFVLFAAEWWRRHYEGGSWKWEPILDEINHPGWKDPAKIKYLVGEGCQYWQRAVFQHEKGNNDYLGTVFFEAGLPLGLLTSGGYVRTLLLRAFSLLESNRVSQSDAVELISQQAQSLNLPEVLAVPPFFRLINTVVSALLALKKTYTLASQEQPLAYLNQYAPDWRDSLPVKLDDGPNAGSFIDGLLIDVAKLPRAEPSHISITYQLVSQQRDWSIKALLSIPDGLHKPENLQLAPGSFANLSATVLLKIAYDGTEKLLGYGYRHGSDQLSIRGLKEVTLPAGIHTTSWQLVFANNQSDYQVTATLPYSEGLDANLPWVFTRQTNNKLLLKGVGSARLAAAQAFVACPIGFTYEGPADGLVEQGRLADQQAIYLLSSTGLFRDANEDESFRIRLSEPQEDQYYFALRPESNTQRISIYPNLNAHVFLGFPRICKIHNANGWQLYCTDNIQYKITGSPGWQSVTNPDQLVGCFRIRLVSSEGDVLLSREIAVLPRSFRLSFQASDQHILFTNTFTMRLSVADQPDARVEKETNGYRVSLPADNQTRDKLKINLTGIGPKPVTLFVPALTSVGYVTGHTGQLVNIGQTIDFQQLYGSHLVLNNLSSQEQVRQVILTLVDRYNPDAAQIRREKKVKVQPFSTEEIALISYKPDIEKLLSFTETVDATVRIQFGVGSGVQIAHYKYITAFDSLTRRVTIKETSHDLTGLSLRAFPLDIPFNPDTVIDLPIDEDGWTFPAEAVGKWFYYVGKSSVASIRPKVAVLTTDIVKETHDIIDEIHEATNLSFADRQWEIKGLFDRIAGSFDNVNWKTLQQLHQSTQYLPLNALDVWKALVKSNRGLVSFYLLSDSLTIGKLSREFSVNWHMIPVAVWIDGFRRYQCYLETAYPPSVAGLVLTAKIQELEDSFSLKSLSQLIRTQLLDQPASQEFLFCQYSPFIQPIINDVILGGVNSPGLIHQHQNRFPVYFSSDVIQRFGQLPEPVRNLLPIIPSSFGYIRPVAYLPVVLAYHSVVPDTFSMATWDQHKMQQLVDFDIEYFSHIYNLIQSFSWLTLANQ